MKKPKPQTKLAKEDAALQSEHRRKYLPFDDDAARFGRPVADFNAGFIAGQDHEKKKHKPATPRRKRR